MKRVTHKIVPPRPPTRQGTIAATVLTPPSSGALIINTTCIKGRKEE